MAIYYLGVKSFGRNAGTGGSVSTSAAAYRSGERIRDERTDRVYDHSHRRDVDYKEILLPTYLSDASLRPDWAKDRSQLWNAVERSEPRPNARVAREYVLALPHELSAERRTALARTFAQEISDRYHNAVDLAVHQPRTDPRNFHAHLLATTREITATGLGRKTDAELGGSQRFELGLPRAMEEHAQIRARWAAMTNEALREAGLEVRVSHLPDTANIQRAEARAWLPRVAWEMERRGEHSVLGDRAREQFARQREAAQAAQAARPSVPMTADGIAKQSALNWAAYRAAQTPTSTPTTAIARDSGVDRQIDTLRRELGRDDFGL